MSLPQGLTKAVLSVHGYRCRYCNEAATEADHIVPRLLGGTDAPENLTACCRSCNARKGGYRLPHDVEHRLIFEAFALGALVSEVAKEHIRAYTRSRKRAAICLDRAHLKEIAEAYA